MNILLMNTQSEHQINFQGTDEWKCQEEKSQTAKGQVTAGVPVLSLILVIPGCPRGLGIKMG